MEKEKMLNEVYFIGDMLSASIEALNKAELLVNYLYDESGDTTVNVISRNSVNTTAAMITNYTTAAMDSLEQIRGKIDALLVALNNTNG